MNTLKNALVMTGICLSIVACQGDGGNKMAATGGGSGTNLPLGACDITVHKITDITSEADTERFIYARGANADTNHKTTLALRYVALTNDKPILSFVNQVQVGIQYGFCTLLPVDNSVSIKANGFNKNSVLGLKNCNAKVEGNHMNFYSTYGVYDSTKGDLVNQKPSKSGNFNFSCNLLYTDGNIPQ